MMIPAASPLAGQTDSATVVAGAEYEAGWLHALLLGREYREEWTTPVRVPVLDLSTFAGGVEPVRRGGGVQTMSLRFEGADGREYNFRSVNKDYSHSVPSWARGTLLEWLRADQTSAQHPAAAIVATPLLDAAGILNPGPRLVVMPDDPRLGEFREDYAGMLGTIELHANEGENNEPLFAGSRRIAQNETVLDHIMEGPEHRVEGAAYLASRLMSIFLGDWDRHGGQFRWARYERDGVYWWVPIPEDRDYAFVHHDGLLLGIARAALTARLIRFREDYADLVAMMSNSQELNRQLLAPVSRAQWDSVATAVHARLTDEAIAEAVATMPAPWLPLSGPELERKLRARRDRFLEMSQEYYRLMARNVEVHATDERDLAEVDRRPDGQVEVRLYALESEAWGDRPYFRRTFEAAETGEIRIFLHGGDDRAVVRGSSRGSILVRVIGGGDDDVLVDSSRAATVFYDARGENRFVAGPRTRVDRRPWEAPEEEPSLLPNTPRDWEETRSLFTPVVEWLPEAGLLVGGGPRWTRYGFRHHPYAARHHIHAAVAAGAWRGRLGYTGDIGRENSRRWLALEGVASNVDLLRFHGFGNDSPRLPDDSVLTWLKQARVSAAVSFPVAGGRAGVGPVLRYTTPEVDEETVLATARPYGTESVGEAGGVAWVNVDRRDQAGFPTRGFRLAAEAAAYAPVWDVRETFGSASLDAAAYVPVPIGRTPVLAFRAGGRSVLGDFPVQHAAFLGGRNTLRGFPHHRFAGDAAAYGTAELRVPLFPANLVARGLVGISGHIDAGRVWVDGRSPGGWHTAPGAGLWFSTPLFTVGLDYARGEEDGYYLRLGMPF